MTLKLFNFMNKLAEKLRAWIKQIPQKSLCDAAFMP
jgi:hypothetical protein